MRLAAGAAVLIVLATQLGTGPFVEALQSTSLTAVAVAVVVTALTMVCCAWRWRLVARALGLEVPLGSAVGAYYRAAFLNATLPGGVLGDVHRAVDHGLETGQMSRTVRSVAWERSLGQVAQIGLTVVVLLAVPSPLRSSVPLIGATAVALAIVAVVLLRRRMAPARRLPARMLHAVVDDLAAIVRAPRVGVGILLASVLVVLGHAGVFLVAVRAAGVEVSAVASLPLALVVLLAASIPTSIAGWGPREGIAAWAFAVAGLGAAQGLTVSVVYGVIALVATLPGAVVLVARRRSGRRAAPALAPAAREVAHG